MPHVPLLEMKPCQLCRCDASGTPTCRHPLSLRSPRELPLVTSHRTFHFLLDDHTDPFGFLDSTTVMPRPSSTCRRYTKAGLMSAFHESTPIPCIPFDGPINIPDPFSGSGTRRLSSGGICVDTDMPKIHTEARFEKPSRLAVEWMTARTDGPLHMIRTLLGCSIV